MDKWLEIYIVVFFKLLVEMFYDSVVSLYRGCGILKMFKGYSIIISGIFGRDFIVIL